MAVLLIWKENNLGEDGIRVYRSTSPMDVENMPPPLADLPPDTVRFEDGSAVDGQVYYYRVSAYLNSGVERFSDEIEVQPVEIGAPKRIPGLVQWYSADKITSPPGPVAEWPDAGPYGRHATQSNAADRPILVEDSLNKRPGVHFVDSSDSLTFTPQLYGDAHTLYVVAKNLKQSHTSGTAVLIRNGRASAYFRASGAQLGTAGGGDGYGGDNKDAAPISTGAPYALFLARQGTSAVEAYYNGNVLPSASGNNYLLDSPIGTIGSGYIGTIYEVAVFDRVLTDQERRMLDSWVSYKYGIRMEGL